MLTQLRIPFCRTHGRLLKVAVGLLIFLVAPRMGADDRDLLRTSAGRPYVFLLVDTSSSMAGPAGQLVLPYPGGDSPESKMYQAKAALHEVISEVDFIDFGFATFNKDSVQVQSKHWLYEALESGVAIPGGGTYPAVGDVHVFGRTQTCYLTGCTLASPADLSNALEAGRMKMYSKLGSQGNSSTTFYLKTGNSKLEVTFTGVGSGLGGEEIKVAVRIRTFNNGDALLTDTSKEVAFGRVEGYEAGFIAGDPGFDRTSQSANQRDKTLFAYEDTLSDQSCRGWEANNDSNQDIYGGNNLLINTPSALGGNVRTLGDLVPLSWESDNKDVVLSRLAPNRLLENPLAVGFEPDFRVAPFLHQPNANQNLELLPGLVAKQSTVLIPQGYTSLGNAIHDFRDWFGGWRDLAADGNTGDPDFGCRNIYLILITDGLETCNSNAGGQATALRRVANVKTFVIGFGSDATADEDVLDDVADRGGTEIPYRPQSSDELIAVLRRVLGEIQQAEVTFASAAAPTAQLNVADKVFFSDFIPLREQSVWDGHVRAFLKPVPLTAEGILDRDRRCATGEGYGCLAWDSGEEIVEQSMTPAELTAALVEGGNVDPLGAAEDQRRVFYSAGAPPLGTPDYRAPFWADDDSPSGTWWNLLFGLGIPANLTPTDDQKAQGKEVLEGILGIRSLTTDIVNPDGTTVTRSFEYVLGDSFHSDPLIVSQPDDFGFFSLDYGSNGKSCTDSAAPNPGYRCYVEKHLYRRKMLLIGSNDGQIHGFDAGILRESNTGKEKEFDDGTGKELFAYIPRGTQHTVRRLGTGVDHRFGVDGALIARDVFLDPKHLGIPDAQDRQWRSVVLGSLREGGRSILALDVTQPDRLGKGRDPDNNDGIGDFVNIPVPLAGSQEYVPSCWNGAVDSSCGPLPFPSMLWEFMDASDEDGNGLPDLGDTWSTPSVGVIQVRNGAQVENRFVAVFGGGIDPNFRQADASGISFANTKVVGNWLYMVDIETGKTLYKRRVSGAVPSSISAVDTDRNLYLDTIYFGTTAGLLYKVDLSGVIPDVEDLEDWEVTTGWEPFVIFNTGGREIFYPPAVIFIGTEGYFALGFGTGYRENLWWQPSGATGKYYTVVDQGFQVPFTPLTELDLAPVDAQVADRTTDEYLLTGQGWVMTLLPGERQISNSFTVSGVTLFNTYKPDLPAPTTSGSGDQLCARTGVSRVYVVSTLNANGYLPTEALNASADSRLRAMEIVGFAASPFVEQLGTKNQRSDQDSPEEDDYLTADELSEDLVKMLADLKKQFPEVCRFSNRNKAVRLRLHTGELRTPLVFPVCTVQHNWIEK